MRGVAEEPLQARHALTISYRRSVGGATERFLAGLARGEILGSAVAGERVVVPPVDYDPETGAAAGALVRVDDAGVVRTWTWVSEPRPGHPLDRPFAFALVQLDGTDTALFHIVDAGNEERMETGMRVRADWRTQRVGSVRDIRAFVPAARSAPARTAGAPFEKTGKAVAAEVLADVRLEYTYQPGEVLSGFMRALGRGRIEGGRCPSCAAVFVPPRPRCPRCVTGPLEAVLVPDRGTIVSYTVVHLPAPGITDVPFAWAWIRLDGANVPIAHLLGEIALDDIRVGQTVQAVWAPAGGRVPGWESIRHFRPVRP